jgi:hypothetical protein
VSAAAKAKYPSIPLAVGAEVTAYPITTVSVLIGLESEDPAVRAKFAVCRPGNLADNLIVTSKAMLVETAVFPARPASLAVTAAWEPAWPSSAFDTAFDRNDYLPYGTKVTIGLGRIVALYYRSSTLYYIHCYNRCLFLRNDNATEL